MEERQEGGHTCGNTSGPVRPTTLPGPDDPRGLSLLTRGSLWREEGEEGEATEREEGVPGPS